MEPKSIPAGELRRRCSALLDEVAETRQEVVITRRGRPVARLVPIAGADEDAVLSSLRGRARLLVDESEFLSPSTVDAGWELCD